jgi:bifunctional DNase/RNase
MEEMLRVEIWTVAQTTEGNVVLLRPLDKNIVIPVFVGQLEIQSILIGMEEISLPRPLTHDLFLSLLDTLGLALDRVEIRELNGNTFYANLVISGGKYTVDKPLIVDSRPSDALGLATRRKCPIMVSEGIIKQTGIGTELFMDMLGDDKKAGAARVPQTSPQGVEPEVRVSPLVPQTSPQGEVSPLDNQEKRNRLQRQLNEAVEKEEYEEAAKIRDMLNELPA